MSPLRRLIPYVTRYRRKFILGLMCVVVTRSVALAGPTVLGFAIDDLTSTYRGETIVVVSHGMVLSLYIAHLNNIEQSASMIWQTMGLPDIAIVDPRWRFLISGFRGEWHAARS